MSFHVPEKHRLRDGPYASDVLDGNNGAFGIRLGGQLAAYCIASDQEGWEHVSVSIVNRRGHPAGRTPSWDEMAMIKALFWDPDDCVMQLHPPEADYVNTHPHVLHLWRPTDQAIPRPPRSMV